MQLDLPAPVAPAISTCGSAVRSSITGLPGDVAAERRLRAGAWPAPSPPGGEEVAQGHELALAVRHLDADRAAPGIGARMRTSGDAIAYAMSWLEAGDAVDLHARAELELVAGDRRARPSCRELGVDAVLGQRRLEHLAALLDEATVDPCCCCRA